MKMCLKIAWNFTIDTAKINSIIRVLLKFLANSFIIISISSYDQISKKLKIEIEIIIKNFYLV